MLLHQEAVLDRCVLNNSDVVSVNMRGIVYMHSKASKHVTNKNTLFCCCPHSHEFSGVGGGLDCPLSFAMIDNWSPTNKNNDSRDRPLSYLVMSMVRIDKVVMASPPTSGIGRLQLISSTASGHSSQNEVANCLALTSSPPVIIGSLESTRILFGGCFFRYPNTQRALSK
mgnify:CR=1 FL=1